MMPLYLIDLASARFLTNDFNEPQTTTINLRSIINSNKIVKVELIKITLFQVEASA